jgi:tRNA A-37 threonylcarbamoyl transferase component Bud32
MSPTGASSFRRSYAMYGAIAAGGMATVHLGRLLGPSGFSRRVAIKRLHPQFAADAEIASMFVEEARLSARVAHVNVVSMLDVVSADGELLLVMDYVHGESVSRLLAHGRAAGVAAPVPVVVTVIADVLHGLHAAHEATGEDGAPLRLIHRDVSPQNVLVGADGVARVVDFGIAKAVGQAQITRDGEVRGKIPYMAPEQLLRRSTDRRVDVWAAGVVLWEALAGKRLFQAEDEPTLFSLVLEQVIAPPSHHNPAVSPELDRIVLRALERDPEKRFANAQAMAHAVEQAVVGAPSSAVAEWVKTNAANALAEREAKIAEMERDGHAERVEAGASQAVRAPSASVFFRDAAPPASASGVSAKARSADDDTRAETTGVARKRRIAITGAVALFLVAGAAAPFAIAHRPGAIASAPVVAASASPTDSSASPLASANASSTVAPIASVAAPAPPLPTLTKPSSPPRAVAQRWCKVFDPDKHIFVMRPMKVSRCP